MSTTVPAPTKNERLLAWVEEVAALTEPDAIHWCDGSAEEYDRLCQHARRRGHVREALGAKRPNSYLALSDPGDVARVEDRTFICSEREEDAGPTNNWTRPRRDARDADRACSPARWRAARCTSCRSRWARSARTIATSASSSPTRAYVAVSMRIMTRMGQGALDVLGEDGDFVPCLHSVGTPLADGVEDVPGPATPRTSTSSTSPRPARSGPTARATAATRCSARSASRCASPR